MYYNKIVNFFRTYQNYLVVFISLIFSTLTGYLRQTSIAYVLGAGKTTDIFLVSYAIPEFVFIALPIILTPVIIPFFIRLRQKFGEETAWSFAKKIFIFFVIIILVLVFINFVASSVFIRWLSPGFEKFEHIQAGQLFNLMLPGIFFMGLASLMGAFLQIFRKFARPILMTAVYNVVFIICLFMFPDKDALVRAGWGVTLGALAAFLLQLPLFLKLLPSGIFNHWQESTFNGNFSKVYKLTIWIAAGYLTHHTILFIDRAMATSTGEGNASILSFAYHLALTIGQLSGLAVSMVIFPDISEKLSESLFEKANQYLVKALKLVFMFSLPVSFGLILFRLPVTKLLFEHGAFGSNTTNLVGNTLIYYTISVFVDSLCQPLWRTVYAWQKGSVVFYVNLVQTFIRLAANFILVKNIGYNGIALSAVLGLLVQFVLLVIIARRQFAFKINLVDVKEFGTVIFASVFAMVVILWGEMIWNREQNIFFLILYGSIFVISYLFVLLVINKLLKHKILKGMSQ
ncbi:MAG: hypothetical protein CVU46_01185 [Chloroflexi bacterium HGW-Chloroflexi-8]|nr:MAG: hypothetical protein CVU46_01185 [Chloroflexi bacterium HGW-Chloroflexi-8]